MRGGGLLSLPGGGFSGWKNWTKLGFAQQIKNDPMKLSSHHGLGVEDVQRFNLFSFVVQSHKTGRF
jgi:hypothetical protein